MFVPTSLLILNKVNDSDAGPASSLNNVGREDLSGAGPAPAPAGAATSPSRA